MTEEEKRRAAHEALGCLYLAVDASVAKDVCLKVQNYIAAVTAERDRYKALHDAELGMCEPHCDEVAELRATLAAVREVVVAMRRAFEREGWRVEDSKGHNRTDTMHDMVLAALAPAADDQPGEETTERGNDNG